MSRRESGFSIIELVVAATVILAISAVALPIFSNALNAYRLTNAAGELANMISLDRFTAIQKNNLMTLRQVQTTGGLAFFVDSNSNGSMEAVEPRYLVPNEMQIVTPGGNVPGPSAPGFPYPGAAILSSPSGTVTFDARGTVHYGAAAPVVYMIIVDSPGQPQAGYRAITVTPMGQIKTWIWNAEAAGGTWTSF
jgi:type II secretory pathway pseudopilin PulG